jgi:hypothetical protein
VDAPQLPDEGSAPSSAASPLSGGTPTPPAEPAKRKRRPSKTLLIALVITVAVVIPTALAIGIFAYGRATEPDRSTPIVSTDAFLHAVFVEKNETTIGLFSCEGWPAGQALAAMNAGIDPEVKVSWGRYSEQISTPDKSTVNARLTLRLGAATELQEWRFDVTHTTDGWRVCGAERLPS